MLTQRELVEKQARREAILKEKDDILAKTKLHRENPTKEGNEELKQFITRSKELETELNKINAELQADEVERGAQNIIIKPNGNKGDGEMNFENMTREQLLSSPIYRDAFYKKVFRDKINTKLNDEESNILRAVTDMNAGSIAAGSEYLLPTTTVNKIQSIMEDKGVLWKHVAKTNFKGNVEFPVGARTSATPDATTGVAKLVYTFTQVAIKQTAVVAEIKVPNLLLANAIDDLETYLAVESAKYLLEQLDGKVLNGDTDKFDSILTSGTTAEYANGGLNYSVIMEIESKMKSAYAKNAIWVMNRKTYFTKVKTMTDTAGNLISGQVPLVNQNNARSVQYLLDGIPVEFSDDLADGAIMFANFDYYKANVSKNITVNVNSSRYEDEDMTAWYAKVYAGGQILFPAESIVYYTEAAA